MDRPERPSKQKSLLSRMNRTAQRAVIWPFHGSLLDETPDFDDYKPGKVEHFITTSSIRHAGRWSTWLTELVTPGRAWGCLGVLLAMVLFLILWA